MSPWQDPKVEGSQAPGSLKTQERPMTHRYSGCSHFTGEETEAQRGEVSCPRSHTQEGAETGLRSPGGSHGRLQRVSAVP